MNGPWTARAATASALACALAAHAQLLDLGGPTGPPAPGESVVWNRYAESIAANADAAAPNEPVQQAADAARRLSAALIRRGESLGAEGSTHIVLGLTLRALIAQPVALDEPTLRVFAVRATRLASQLPRDPGGTARAVRDLVALPMSAINSATEAAPTPVIPTADLDADALAALRRLEADLTEAARHAAYAPSVATLQSALGGAARVLDTPAWVTTDAQDALRRVFVEAIAQLAPPAQTSTPSTTNDAAQAEAGQPDTTQRSERAAAVAQLRTLGVVAGALAALDLLDADDADGAVEQARIHFVTRLETEPTRDDTVHIARALQRAARLINPPVGAVPGESDLLRPLRPVHRGFLRERRASIDRLTASLPLLASDPDAPLAPDTAGVLAQARRTLEELNALTAHNSLCENAEFGPRLAIRTLELSRGLSAASRADIDAALAPLRRLVRDAEHYGDLTSAARLNSEVLATQLGDQAPRVRAAMEATSTALFEAWRDGAALEDLTPLRQDAEAYRRLAHHLAVWANLLESPSPLQRAPLAEFPPEAIGALRDAAGNRLAPAVRAAIRRDPDGVRRALDGAQETDAALAAGALAASLHPYRPTTGSQLASAIPERRNRASRDAENMLVELATAGTMISGERVVTAERSRYAAELGLALALNIDPAPRLTEHVRTLALEIESDR
ncbi:MAG: hypothetical protein AAF138_10545 [Planctomycetota bacterium]